MSNRRTYDVDYKKTLVSLYENGHSVKNLSEEHSRTNHLSVDQKIFHR